MLGVGLWCRFWHWVFELGVGFGCWHWILVLDVGVGKGIGVGHGC